MEIKDEDIIKFYGSEKPELFEIERRCMDRDGKVIDYLQNKLPFGKILDIGAGNGYTAEKLQHPKRQIIALEPDSKMIDTSKDLFWVKGVAQYLPFHDKMFDAVYSTWAFFFPDMGAEMIDRGVNEIERVIKPDGKIFIIDNAGNDEFSSFTERYIGNENQDFDYWGKKGFKKTIINTHFKFDSVAEAQKLLGFYFGEKGKSVDKTAIEYNVAVYKKY